jgi:hypothetical protein
MKEADDPVFPRWAKDPEFTKGDGVLSSLREADDPR